MSDDNGWGATFHRHFGSNEIHRDGGQECNQPGTPREVYVFDPDALAEHDAVVRAETLEEVERAIADRIEPSVDPMQDPQVFFINAGLSNAIEALDEVRARAASIREGDK